ncbi:hypothetical protein EJ110_NYTH45841 [Nymphaea thermarum]|nr:hypothetical protein EJ110_NYTH45841 [Nymphaea thermarum]
MTTKEALAVVEALCKQAETARQTITGRLHGVEMSNSKLGQRMSNMEKEMREGQQQLMSQLREVINKASSDGGETQRKGSQLTNLPHGRHPQSGTQLRNVASVGSPALMGGTTGYAKAPMMEFPKFNGDNPLSWIFRADQYSDCLKIVQISGEHTLLCIWRDQRYFSIGGSLPSKGSHHGVCLWRRCQVCEVPTLISLTATAAAAAAVNTTVAVSAAAGVTPLAASLLRRRSCVVDRRRRSCVVDPPPPLSSPVPPLTPAPPFFSQRRRRLDFAFPLPFMRSSFLFLLIAMADAVIPKIDDALDTGSNTKSENLPVHVTSIRLNKDNYLSWSAALEIGITSRGRLHYITGERPAPSKTDPQWATWALEDSQVKVWIISSVSADIQPLILRKSTAYDMWTVLARMYGRKKRVLRAYQIKRSIYAIKQGDLSVASFYAALKTMIN